MSTIKRALRPGDVAYWKESNRCGIVICSIRIDETTYNTTTFNIIDMETGEYTAKKTNGEKCVVAPKAIREKYFDMITRNVLRGCGRTQSFGPDINNEKDAEDDKKIVRLIASQAPVFVPLTKEVKQLPIRDDCYYILANSEDEGYAELFCPDYGIDAVSLPREIEDGCYTHVAIVEKPQYPLPDKISKDMVFTALHDRALQDLKDMVKGGKK